MLFGVPAALSALLADPECPDDHEVSLRPPEDVDPDVRFDRENAAEMVNGEAAAAEATDRQAEEGPVS